VAGRPRTAATRAKHKAKRRVIKRQAMDDVRAALLATAECDMELVIAREVPVSEVLSIAMRRVHVAMLWAGQQSEAVPVEQFWVEKLDAQGNVLVQPNKWFQLERSLRDEAVKLAARMVELGLAERQVAVEEAKAVMVAQAVRTAAEAAGIPPEQIVRLGEELRKGLETGAVQETAA
jgi:hypothetical protein